MAKAYEVLEMLIPQGGWILQGEDYEGIEFLQCNPITKAEFEAGFTQYDAWKAEQDQDKTNKRNAALSKLAALGLNVDDLAALGF